MAEDLIVYERGFVRFVKNPDTGEVLPIERDERYVQGMQQFWGAECAHSETQIMRVRVAGGATQVRNCCTSCGERVGNPLSQKDKGWVKSLPEFTGDTQSSYKQRRYAEQHAFLLQLARTQFAERGKFTRSYRAYLASSEWKRKRELVLNRCEGVCEGCGEAAAVHIHHKTYWHFGNEFLFELLGLCEACHERIHSEEEQTHSQHTEEATYGTEPDDVAVNQ